MTQEENKAATLKNHRAEKTTPGEQKDPAIEQKAVNGRRESGGASTMKSHKRSNPSGEPRAVATRGRGATTYGKTGEPRLNTATSDSLIKRTGKHSH